MKLMEMIISLFILGSVGVAAITTIATANTTGWGATTITMWGIVGTMAILAIVYKFLPKGVG